jgi:hypothetical protein
VGQVDERDPVAIPVRRIAGHPDGETRLAGPARTRERHETNRRIGEASREVVALGAPSDEGGRLGGEAANGEVERGERRIGARQSRMLQLEHPLRPTDVAQAVLAKVTQRRVAREVVGGQRGRGRGQKDLAAVTGRHDPRRPVDGRAEEVVSASLGLPGVDGHPDPERTGRRPGF